MSKELVIANKSASAEEMTTVQKKWSVTSESPTRAGHAENSESSTLDTGGRVITVKELRNCRKVTIISLNAL